jgi:hypothetical protein
MSNALAFAGVTAVLKDLLDTGLIDHEVTDIMGQGVTVSALAPDAIQLGNEMGARLNLFMHQATPNAAWRNAAQPSRDATGRRIGNAPLAVDLHYLLTAYANADLQAEVLLGYAMQLFHETPVLARGAIRTALNPPNPPVAGSVLPTVYQALRASDLADQYEQIKITPSVMNTEELSKLWTALQAHYRPTAAYQVTVVLIESQRQARSPLPVLSRNIPLYASLLAPIPEIESVKYQASQIAAQLGEDIELEGHDLDGAQHELVLTNARLGLSTTITPASSVTAKAVHFTLPLDPVHYPAGIHGAQLRLARGADPAPIATGLFPLTIAPQVGGLAASLHLDANGDLSLTPTCTPQVWPNQNVSLLLDGIEVFAEPFDAQTATPTFIFRALTPAIYRVRLRVDGVDSVIVNRAVNPPTFIGPQVEVLP